MSAHDRTNRIQNIPTHQLFLDDAREHSRLAGRQTPEERLAHRIALIRTDSIPELAESYLQWAITLTFKKRIHQQAISDSFGDTFIALMEALPAGVAKVKASGRPEEEWPLMLNGYLKRAIINDLARGAHRDSLAGAINYPYKSAKKRLEEILDQLGPEERRRVEDDISRLGTTRDAMRVVINDALSRYSHLDPTPEVLELDAPILDKDGGEPDYLQNHVTSTSTDRGDDPATIPHISDANPRRNPEQLASDAKEREVARERVKELLDGAQPPLSVDERTAYRLKHGLVTGEEMTVAEVAEAMSISIVRGKQLVDQATRKVKCGAVGSEVVTTPQAENLIRSAEWKVRRGAAASKEG